MADQAVDYAALAKQAGAFKSFPAIPPPVQTPAPTPTTTPAVDYDAIAKEAGAVSSTPAAGESAVGRFVKGAAETALPSTTPNDYNFFDTKGGAGYAVRHPIDSASLVLGSIKDAHLAQASKVGSAYDRLRTAKTLEDKLSAAADLFQHAAGTVVPLIGPAVSSAVDTMKEGDVARGAGQLTGIAAPLLAGKAVGAIAPEMSGVADVAGRVSTEKMADVIAPKVGRQKQRFGGMAADVAPDLARDPRFAAISRAGLQAKVESAFEDATSKLDAAHDARNPATARYPTKGIVDALTAERQKLVAEPVEASQPTAAETTRTSPIVDADGKPITVTDRHAAPLGSPVVPSQNSAAYQALSTAIDNVKKLGPVASYDDLRTLRQAWDKSAQKIYTPSVVQDFLTARDEGLAWSRASGNLRDFLAERDPTTAAANADYSLLRRAHDVLSATEETERTRPHRGAQTVAAVVGTATGGHFGGVPGAIVGAMLGPAVDAAMTSGVTTKIATARILASLSDALRGTDATKTLGQLKQLAAVTGQSARFAALTKATAADLAALPAAASAKPATPDQTGRR